MAIKKEVLLLAVGYGLYKTASSAEYLSAMGTTPTNLGFVSHLPFMMATCAAEAIGALLLILLSSMRPTRDGWFEKPAGPFVVGYLFLFVSEAASVASSFVTGGMHPVALGLMRGAGSVAASVAWFEMMVRFSGSRCASAIIGAFALQGVFGIALQHLGVSSDSTAYKAVVAVVYALSLACAGLIGHSCKSDDGSRLRKFELKSADSRGFVSAWTCMLVCQLVVGIVNTAVQQSSFKSIMATVDVNICVVIASILVGAMLAATRKAPGPEFIYKVAMPFLLATFTVAALAADSLGIGFGYIMIGSYEAIALAYSIYFVDFLQGGRYAPRPFIALTSGVASVTLLVGLAAGIGLNILSDNQGVPLLTLIAFVAIYPLVLALLFIQRNRSSSSKNTGGETGKTGAVTQLDVEEFIATRMNEFARRYGLTAREAEVCALLARGKTVRSVATELGISENTVWTHTRNLYSKCGVATKQELIGLVDSCPYEDRGGMPKGGR